jgi:flagellar protein FliO/FliZ
MNSGITSLLWFVVIVAMIPLALWLLKRTPLGGAATGGLMRSVSVLPLSPSQRLVTVEVGSGAERRWLVLGVTPHNITTLHTMTPQPEAVVPTATPGAQGAAAGFSQMLNRLRQTGNAGKDTS